MRHKHCHSSRCKPCQDNGWCWSDVRKRLLVCSRRMNIEFVFLFSFLLSHCDTVHIFMYPSKQHRTSRYKHIILLENTESYGIIYTSLVTVLGSEVYNYTQWDHTGSWSTYARVGTGTRSCSGIQELQFRAYLFSQTTDIFKHVKNKLNGCWIDRQRSLTLGYRWQCVESTS